MLLYADMLLHEALEQAQDQATLMLAEQYDEQRSIPYRAASHTDLWPGDRWPEAYIAAGMPETARDVLGTIASSIRPDGAVPHLLSGSHIRARFFETHWVDRLVYVQQGNGLQHLPNGEWVTKIFAPPTLALSALAVAKTGLELPAGLDVETVTKANLALYEERGLPTGFIIGRRPDELTNSVGELAQYLKMMRVIVDPAVNALAVRNNAALDELAERLDPTFAGAMQSTFAAKTEAGLQDRLLRSRAIAPLKAEDVLAVARLQSDDLPKLTDAELAACYPAPQATEKHPEHSHLTLAECLEIARLTPYSEASHDYLSRILPKIASLGQSGLTHFENVSPGLNAARNKLSRRQLWLPTAAQVVQISAGSL